eukprot:jgi/Picsp_1/6836/NSC_04173-R1_breast carcinoma amplified sequence 2
MADRLALTLGSHAEQTGWRRNQDVIDALPYVDDVTPEQKKEIQDMIEEEMRNMNKTTSDYESELPTVPDFRTRSGGGGTMLESEIKRVSSATGQPTAVDDGLDLERYSLPRPSDKDKDDVESWVKAIENVMAQLEHQQTRIINLQLLLKHGPNTWRAYNEGLSSLLNTIDHELQVIRGDCNHINRERKMEQLAAGKEIADASAMYTHLVEKNRVLTAEITRLEEKINA